MGHIKITSAGNCFGRIPIGGGPKAEDEARNKATKIVEMHKDHKGDKSQSSPSSNASYNIEFDAAPYPFDTIPFNVPKPKPEWNITVTDSWATPRSKR